MGLNPCSIGILSFNSEVGNDLDLRMNIVKRVKKRIHACKENRFCQKLFIEVI